MGKGIDEKIIEKAKSLALTGLDKEVTFGDDVVSGLSIRVKGSRATWHLRSKPNKMDIGELSAFSATQLGLVRELATKIKAHWKSGRSNAEIKVLINSLVSQSPRNETPLQSAEADMAVKIDGAWTWKVMRTEYLKWAKVHLSDATYIGYHSGLGAAKNSVFKKDFEHIEKKAIANITQLDILMIRHNILERGGMVDGVPAGFIRTAELTEAALRGAFSFALDPRRNSGLKVNPMIGLRGIEKPDVKKRDIVNPNTIFEPTKLTPKQLHDFMFWVIKNEERWSPEAVNSCLLQCLTGQRIETPQSTFRVQIMRTYTSHRYQYVWYLGPDKMKRYRALPLPKFAAWVAHRAAKHYDKRASEEDWRNNFLFRQLRAGKDGRRDGHTVKNLPGQIWLDAREEGGPLHMVKKKPDDPDPPDFSSHDARKAFVSHLGKRGKLLGLPYDNCVKDLQSITHAGEGKATVIEKFYDLDGDEQWRLRCLEMWESLILNAHGEKRRPHPDFFDLDEGEAFGLTQAEWEAMFPDQREHEEEVTERQERDGYALEQAE